MADRLTIHDRILEYLKKNLTGHGFKTFYDGDPAGIPQSSMPCVIVQTNSDENDLGPTGHDAVGEEIVVKLVFNKKDEMGRSQVKESTHEKLRQIIGARDKDSGEYLPNTVKGILRKNFTMTGADFDYKRPLIGNRMRTAYGIQMRPEKLITEEAHVTVSTAENIPVSGRS